jgi:hypothetical protein
MLVGRIVQGGAAGSSRSRSGSSATSSRASASRARSAHVALARRRGRARRRARRADRRHLSFHYLFWLPLIPTRRRDRRHHLFVPESPVRVGGRVDWAGAVLMAAGLAAVLVAVSQAPTWHWLSAKTLTVLAVGVALLVVWVWIEARKEQALVDMRMMRIRGVWTTNAVALLIGFGMYASFVLLPEFVETPGRAGYGFGSSVTAAGLFLCQRTLAMLIAGAQTGRLEKRYGSKPPLLAGAVLTAAAYVFLAVARDERGRSTSRRCCSGPGSGSRSRRWRT